MGGWERSSPLLLFTADTHRSLSQFRLSKDRLSKDATEYSGFMFPWADTPLSRPHLRDAAPSRPAATEQPYLVKLLTGLRAQRQRDRRAVHYALDRYLAAKCNTYRGGRGPKGKTLLECVTQTGDDARSAQLGRLCRRDAALCRARIASGTHRRGRRRLRARASAHEGPGCWRHTLMLTSVMRGVGRLLLYDELWRVRDVLRLASKEICCGVISEHTWPLMQEAIHVEPRDRQ